jgi:hypothetical protein
MNALEKGYLKKVELSRQVPFHLFFVFDKVFLYLIKYCFFTVGVYEEGSCVSRIMGDNAIITICYTEQIFALLSFNWTGKELQLGSLFVLKFSPLSDSIGIYDSKYPKANNDELVKSPI